MIQSHRSLALVLVSSDLKCALQAISAGKARAVIQLGLQASSPKRQAQRICLEAIVGCADLFRRVVLRLLTSLSPSSGPLTRGVARMAALASKIVWGGV